MKESVLFVSLLSVTALFTQGDAIDGTRINGRAVSVHWRSGSLNWGSACCGCSEGWQGPIELYTIQNGSVVGKDVVWDATEGFAYYPAFNLEGNKIAFYRSEKGLGDGIDCPQANGGKNAVSVMDINGQNVRNLCDLPCEIPSGGLDWPAGDWIYYVYPNCERFSTDPRPMTQNNEVWKVNYVTGENVKVCKYQGQGQDMPDCTYFRRFSLNLTGDYMGVQALQKYQCTDPSWFANNVVPFPGGCNVNSGGGNCNMSISASGGYYAYYYGTGHDFIEFGSRSGSTTGSPPRTYISDLEGICGCDLGLGAELIRWATNSDKWVIQQIGWYGHAGNMSAGTNMVGFNWADRAVIRISDNPKITRSTSAGGDGTIYHGNSTGDLWIDGGAEHFGMYEDGSGNWQSVPGFQPTSADYIPAADRSPVPPVDFSFDKRMCFVTTPETHPVSLSVHDMRGRRIVHRRFTTAGVVDLAGIARGSYVVRISTAFGTVSHRVAVE